MSQEFDDHLKSQSTVPQLTPPGTPQRNGVSERRNRNLLDMVRSMMSKSDLPLSFWGYALETAAFTLNRLPSKSVDKTPYEIWTVKSHSLSFLKIWGCEAYVKRLQSDKPHPNRTSAYSWDIQGKPWDITSTTVKRANCLSLDMEFSLRKSFSIGRLVGGWSD